MPPLSVHWYRDWANRRSKGDRNMGMMQEFEEFAVKGNVIDLAVGIVIGTAFGKIVNSLVNDVVMPPIGILISDVDFKSLAITLKHGPDAKSTVTLNYGNFIQTVVEFLIIAWCVFLMVKAFNQIRRMGEKHQPAPEKSATEGPQK
jgi:large conductance mechanosensitive channel